MRRSPDSKDIKPTHLFYQKNCMVKQLMLPLIRHTQISLTRGVFTSMVICERVPLPILILFDRVNWTKTNSTTSLCAAECYKNSVNISHISKN